MSAPSPAATNQRISGPRLWDTLMEIAQIGATPKGGVKRISLTETDKAGRTQFRIWCEAIGLKLRVDSMGNMFARREGRDPSRLPVLFGSHLDSQPDRRQVRWRARRHRRPRGDAYPERS